MAESRSDDTVTGLYIDNSGFAHAMRGSGSPLHIGLSDCKSIINGSDRAIIIHENDSKTCYFYESGNIQSI